MKNNRLILLAMLCMSFMAIAQEDDDMEDLELDTEIEMEATAGIDPALLADAEAAKTAMLESDEDLQMHLDEAIAYVIFPNVGKGALVVGVSSGNGVVYQNGAVIGSADLKKLDVGLQAGVKAFSELIIFKTEEALQRFKNDELEFSAGASAVALKSGKAVDAKYNDGVAVFALPKAGLMAEAAIGGQKFEFHSNEQ